MNNDDGDYQHPEEMKLEISFEIIRDNNIAHVTIINNRFYHDKQIIRFLERLIKEKKLPIGYKTSGVIVLGISNLALIEYYEYSDDDQPGGRKHIIIPRKDYSI
jgi:hypothetical protein